MKPWLWGIVFHQYNVTNLFDAQQDSDAGAAYLEGKETYKKKRVVKGIKKKSKGTSSSFTDVHHVVV